MATRDRTADYIKSRDKVLAHRRVSNYESSSESKKHLFDPSTFHDGDPSTPAVEQPAWVRTIDDVRRDMVNITKSMDELTAMHSNHLKDVFGSGDEDQEQAIEIKTQAIKRLFNSAEIKVKQVADGQSKLLKQREAGVQETLSQDELIRRNVMTSLVTDLKNQSLEFRKRQRMYLQKLKGRSDRTDQLDEKFRDDSALGGASSSRSLSLGGEDIQMNFTEEQEDSLAMNESLIVERNQEIRNVVKSITELSEMFKDLSNLVVEQGTILDRIDYNIEQTVISTEEAVQELTKAHEYQKKSLLKTCILFLIIAVVIVTVLLFIKAF